MIKIIKIFGDEYRIRNAYDIDDFGVSRYGFDVYDENNVFLSHFIGDKINELKRYLKMIIYKF